MKPILHGLDRLIASQTTRVPTDVIDVPALVATFERNIDRQIPDEWTTRYKEISDIYKELFTKGELSQETLDRVPFETLEIAHEHISRDLSILLDTPQPTSGRDYYYEFARSLSVEKAAANMKEHLDEECDFI